MSTPIKELTAFFEKHQQILVITGAGVSVSSGIPTYRDNAGVWSRNAPIQHRDFLQKPASRQRYWARSFAGWPAVQLAQPNASHNTLAQLEQKGHIPLLVIGSSLMVYSGFRFCRHAAAIGIPIACINPGTTRADDLFELKITTPSGPVLEKLLQQLN